MGINLNTIISTIVTAIVINLMTLCLPCFAESVLLSWDANTDPNLAGYKVYYKADSATQPFDGSTAVEGAAPIDVQKQTSATISGLDPAHTYFFAVTAYDSSGIESDYSNIVSVPESIPPSVSLVSPGNNSNVTGTVSVTASASDNTDVVKVEFYVNGVLTASDTTAPYTFAWDTTPLPTGTYTLFAKAYDAAGNVGQSGNSTVSVVRDVVAPIVAVTAPANNATVSGTVAVAASASDNTGVTKVEFFIDGTMSAAVNTNPYTYNWYTTAASNGSHTLSAKAYDASGNISSSSTVTVIVNNVSTQTQTTILGDVNGDGVVDIADALLALQIAVGNIQPTTQELQRGDMAPLINGVSVSNGVIDIGDVVLILSKVVANNAN